MVEQKFGEAGVCTLLTRKGGRATALPQTNHKLKKCGAGADDVAHATWLVE